MSTSGSRVLDDLFRSHAQDVYRFAYALLGSRPDAEDVVQTTFVNALRALERGERPRKPSSWLIAIAHNVVRQRFRQQRARPIEVTLDRELATPEPAGDSHPTVEELVTALQRIPRSQREALVLRELEGRSYDEIARTLGRSKSALETLLFRARRSLADELENAVTCERAELDLSRQLDGRLSRKERKRLNDHIAECASCRALQETHRRRRRAFGGLALLPLPSSLVLEDASAASGALWPSAAGGTSAPAVTGGGIAVGGLALGAVGLTTVGVVVALFVASGIGAQEARRQRSAETAPATVASAATEHEQSGPAPHPLAPPAVDATSLGPPGSAPGGPTLLNAAGPEERSARPVPSAAPMPAAAGAGEDPSDASRTVDIPSVLSPARPTASPAPAAPTSESERVTDATASAMLTDATAPSAEASAPVPPMSTTPKDDVEVGDPAQSAATRAEAPEPGAESRETGPEASATDAPPCDVPGSSHALVVSRMRVEPVAPGLADVARWWVCRPSIEGNAAVTAQDSTGADVILGDPPAAADDGSSLLPAQSTRPGQGRSAGDITGAGRP